MAGLSDEIRAQIAADLRNEIIRLNAKAAQTGGYIADVPGTPIPLGMTGEQILAKQQAAAINVAQAEAGIPETQFAVGKATQAGQQEIINSEQRLVAAQAAEIKQAQAEAVSAGKTAETPAVAQQPVTQPQTIAEIFAPKSQEQLQQIYEQEQATPLETWQKPFVSATVIKNPVSGEYMEVSKGQVAIGAGSVVSAAAQLPRIVPAIIASAAMFGTWWATMQPAQRQAITTAVAVTQENAQKGIQSAVVTAQGQVKAFTVEMDKKNEDIIIDNWPKLEELIRTGFPLEQQQEFILKNMDVKLPSIDSITKVPPQDIKDIIFSDPADTVLARAKDYLLAAKQLAFADEVKKGLSDQAYENEVTYGAMTPEQWNEMVSKLEQVSNIESGRKAINEIFSQYDIYNKEVIHDFQKAIQNAYFRKAILDNAKSTYVQSLNPTPVFGNSTPEEISAYAATVIAAQTAMPKPKPNYGLDTYTEKQVIPKVIADNANQVIAAPNVSPAVAAKTQTAPLAQVLQKQATSSLVQTQTQTAVQTQPAVKTAVQVATTTATKPLTRTMTNIAELTTVMEGTTDINIPIPIILPDGEKRELTIEQRRGTIAWKMGIMYIAWIPPYRQSDLINTRKPIPGVKYFEGPGSAAKSIVALFGEIPPFLYAHMGIVDIGVKGQGTAQPTLTFKSAPKKSKKPKRDSWGEIRFTR